VAAIQQDLGHIPGPVIIQNCAAVRLFWDLPNGKRAYNVLHASYVSGMPFTQTVVNNLFGGITAGFASSALAPFLEERTKLVAVGCRDLNVSGQGFGFTEVVSNTAGVQGSDSSGNSLPPQVALVVSLKSLYARQANRGRVYLGGFSAFAADADGRAKDTLKTAATAFIQSVASALDAQGLDLCIAHPARAAYTGRTGVQYPARNAGFVSVTAIGVQNNVFDTQRLRASV
jgi:hypothetical protein